MHAVVLKHFLEVARCGSIRKAAQNLFIASSAVSRQLLRLEEALGTELFGCPAARGCTSPANGCATTSTARRTTTT